MNTNHFNHCYEQAKEKSFNELKAHLDNYKLCLETLKGVKRAYKKDGTDFQNFLKNFETSDNASLQYEYSWVKLTDKNHKCYIHLYTKYHAGSYKDFVEKIRETNPERVKSAPCSYDWVELTPDEFFEQIQGKIEDFERYIRNTEESLADFDDKAEKIKDLLNGVVSVFGECGDSLYYRLKEISEEIIKGYWK